MAPSGGDDELEGGRFAVAPLRHGDHQLGAPQRTPPPDADDWKGVPDKYAQYFTPNPGKGE